MDLIPDRVRSPPAGRRHRSPPPMESPASRRRSPTPPLSCGAVRISGASPTPVQALSAPAYSFTRRRRGAVTTVPDACSTPGEDTVYGSICGPLQEQPDSTVVSGCLPQSSSSDFTDHRPKLTVATPGSEARPPALTAAELGLADVVMCYRSIVLLIFAVVVIYNDCSRPLVLVSEIAGILCLYFYFWSTHIIQFWLHRPYNEDSSIIVLLCCFALFIIAFLVGVNVSPLAGMCITCFATMCMIGSLAGCIWEYNSIRRSLVLEPALSSDIHGGKHIEQSITVFDAPREQVSPHIQKRRTPMFSRKPTANANLAKPAWK